MYVILEFILAFSLFAAMLVLMEAGRRIGKRRLGDSESSAGLGAVEGAVFGLVGLLIAFTFSGAAGRFDGRRDLIVQEGNAIGTAYLRLDLLPEPARAQLQEDFRQYVDSRLAIYRALPDMDAAMSELARSGQIQNRIWSRAVEAVKPGGNAITSLVLSSLNEMIDVTTTRTVAAQSHPPVAIFVTLVLMVLAGSLFAGHGMAPNKQQSRLHSIGFAAIMAFAVCMIVDLEFPRLGLIRVDKFDQILVDVRASMK